MSVIHQDDDPFFTFPIDHVIAMQHGGQTDSENLCLSCYRCNSQKGPNIASIASIDPESGTIVRLFHPRKDDWAAHFGWREGMLVGRTPIGRATVALLAVNHPDSVVLREALIEEGRFPT